MRRFPFLLSLALALALSGCATRLKPGADLAATWAEGPKMSVGLGEYEIGTGPNPFLVGTSEQPDPEVQKALVSLDERSKVLNDRISEVALQASNPSLSPEAKAELENLSKRLETAKVEGDAKAQAAREAAARAEALAKEAKDVPTGLTIPEGSTGLGLIMVIAGFVLNSMKKRALLKAKAEAEALAKKLAAEAVADYDALPENVQVLRDGRVVPLDNAGLPKV